MTDYKQLCAELHAAFNTYAVDECHHALLERARTALAEPGPEVPTDEQLKQWYSDCADETTIGSAEHYWAFEIPIDYANDLVRAALTRWGNCQEILDSSNQPH